MKDDQQKFLSLLDRAPARLTAEQAAWVLNCGTHDVPVLVAAGLLKPLGKPAPNSTKFFATVELLELTSDRNWLGRVTAAIQQHWQGKNSQRKVRPTDFNQPRDVVQPSPLRRAAVR